MKAKLKNYRQSPRKVRLVADLIRGKSVEDAMKILDFTYKRAADPLKKLLSSAIANAENNEGKDKNNLQIKEIAVNKGITLKRWRPRAQGRTFPILKRTSHINIELEETEPQVVSVGNADKKEENK